MEGVIATILMFAGNFVPKNWLPCNGQTISIASNTALFSLLGTTYGGNGTTTFAVPNFQGRLALGAGQGPGLSDYALGQAADATVATMSIQQMPSHIHTGGVVSIPLTSNTATVEQPANNILATPNADTYAVPGTLPAALNGGFTAQAASVGGGQPFSIMQPYLAMNYVICAYGVFPARP
jgi:microcystin-dependent protein